MYRLKEGIYEKIKEKNPMFKVKGFAEIVGLKPCWTSLILNRKRTCGKTTAYCITKAIDPNLEIDDIFDRERV